MTEQPQPASEAPITGQPQIDAALAGLAGLAQLDATEQLSRLGAAHEVLVRVLETSRQPIPAPRPVTQHR